MLTRVVASLALLAAVGVVRAQPSAPPHSFEWQTATPASQGMSQQTLDALKDRLAAASTKAFLVIRNDRLVYEWYAADHSATAKHYTASMAKGIVGGLSVAIALTDKRVALDAPAAQYVPQWKADTRKSQITLRHLGSHTSGLDDAEEGGLAHDSLTGWKGDFWKRLDPPNDPFTLARDRTPVVHEPGKTFQYSNPGMAMLTYALTSALRGAPQADARTLLRDRVMRPIGVADGDWTIGYGATYTVDGLPLVPAWGGASYTARAVARIGRLMRREGDWSGTGILSREAVQMITTDAGAPGHGAIGWWSNNEGKYPRLPRDAFWASGAGHQVVFVVPSLDLIAVRNGGSLGEAIEHHDTLNASLFEPLVDSIAVKSAGDAGPYPRSSVIDELVWAPADTIRRYARGSDIWALTWGDDGALYGAYGDGQGFEPMVPRKLSMGFARIAGAPGSIKGLNIRSESGEALGDGRNGKKPSGLLMVGGVLYLWVRNAGNSQLAWSADRGATWTWGTWKFADAFGAPTFLNFGRNYSGARDGFVYVYSHDSDDAYTPADRMVLARVPADRIRDRDAYEFLEKFDSARRPAWTRSIERRGAVFSSPGSCYRSAITYNAALRRYLWTQTLPAGDARFAGGFGIYDAPEPWGPWTTAYYAAHWDVGPGETSSFPTKWMSRDGTVMHLVFSGEDALSVRRVSVRLRSSK